MVRLKIMTCWSQSRRINMLWGAKNKPKPLCKLSSIDERDPVSKACNRGAWRLGEAGRSHISRKTYWHQEKAKPRDSKTCIVEGSKPSWQLCLARIFTAWPSQLPSWHCAKLQVKKLSHQTFRKSVPQAPGPEVPPQRITDLDNVTRQFTHLVAFWIVALSQRATKSVKHRKLCCYCPVLKKDLARLRKSTMPTYRTQLTTMIFLSTRDPLREAEDRQSIPETIWVASERRYCFCRFTLGPVSHHVSQCFNFQLSFCHMAVSLLAFGLCRSNLWECCPRGSHSVISSCFCCFLVGASVGGASVSALCFCCFLAHRLLYGIFVVCCSLLFYFAIPILRVIVCYHLFWYVSDDYELTGWSPAVLFLLCVLFCVCFVYVGFVLLLLCVFFWLFCVGWMSLHGDSSLDYVSILIQFYFWCTLSIWWCCHCINSLNLQICNWLSGLLNDLARAIWRWTEKKKG